MFQNLWIVTIVGGAIAAVLGWFIIRLFKPKNTNIPNINQTNSQNSTITNNVNVSGVFKENISEISSIKNVSTAEVALHKESAKILFIDDLDLKNKIKNLISAGWKNVNQIKEANNIDQKEIRDADVIFVDYKGIGKHSKEQGLAVIGALKERYRESKWIILFTAHEVPINAFNKGANSYLPKNSSVYELEQKIIDGLGRIHK